MHKSEITLDVAVNLLTLYAYGDKAKDIPPHSFDFTTETTDYIIDALKKYRNVLAAFGLAEEVKA